MNNRFLQSNNVTSNLSSILNRSLTPDDYKSTYDELPVYTLRPLEIAKIVFDLTLVPPLFLYNDHFAVVVLDGENNIQDLPYYFDTNVRNSAYHRYRTTA